MATFGEVIYMTLDTLKEHSDDAYYTEEHVLFLLKKLRAAAIESKYKGARNTSFSVMSPENLQQICLQLQPATDLTYNCGTGWLRSEKEIPELLSGFNTATCTGHDMLQSNVTFIPIERMPYVGYNKWLKNIVYASRSMDGHLYLHGANPQFMYLEQVGLTGVFADPEAAARLSHEACSTGKCDIMNARFPLESALIAQVVELAVNELGNVRYAPEDKKNNAADDLNTVTAASSSAKDSNKSEEGKR